jgi:hypothetical protein
VQATNENQFFKTDYNNMDVTKHSTYLSNISIAFPISKKLKFGFGYQPYSSKDMIFSQKKNYQTSTVIKGNHFQGQGTLKYTSCPWL